MVELGDPHRVDGRADGGHAAVRQYLDVVDSVGVKRGDGAAGRGPETDDDGGEPPAVDARGAGEGQGMDDRAIAGQFVVLVEDMEAEAAVTCPVVHGLEGDQRELLVDGQLGDGAVLDAVRPTPEDLAVAEFRQVLRLRLGQQDDVGVGNDLAAGGNPSHEGGQMGVRNAEPFTVALFEDDVPPQLGCDAVQVKGVEREPAFVRFARAGEDSEAEVVHGTGHFFLGLAALVAVALSRELGGAAAALLSARFSLMDLPDFADAA